MRQKLSKRVLTAILVLVVLFLIVTSSYFISSSSDFATLNSIVHAWSQSPGQSPTNTTGEYPVEDDIVPSSDKEIKAEENIIETPQNATSDTPPEKPSSPPPKEGNATLLEAAVSQIKAITTPEDTSFPRLDCPAPSGDRYNRLKGDSTGSPDSSVQSAYFFALDLHQFIKILPRLFGSIVETIRFLGPENCALSVVEGRSSDGTFEVLSQLSEEMERIGVKYSFITSDINPTGDKGSQRIQALAKLRNLALKSLVDHPEQYSQNATVAFLNDVAICMEDILELIHQRLYQKADMTCGLDWTFVGQDLTFYDVWIARGMNGDSFFEIPADGNWNSAWNLFWNNPTAKERLMVGKPFQLFSCWNGAAVFAAKPLIEKKTQFRATREHECRQGEPQIFCKEMWYHGYGRIAVVPSVNLEYSDEAGKKIKSAKGYVSRWAEIEGVEASTRIEWEKKPPSTVKCIPNYQNQTVVPWDEQLAEQYARR